MGTKLSIKGKNQIIDLPRGAAIPREGEILQIILRGEKKEKLYTVYLIEHAFDFNTALPIGNTVITLEELKKKKSED